MLNHNLIKTLLGCKYIGEPEAEALRDYSGARLLGELADKYLTYEALCDFLASEYRIQSVDLSEERISADALRLLPHQAAVKYNAIPLCLRDDSLVIALADPFDQDAVDDLRLIVGHELNIMFALPRQIGFYINKFYGTENISGITTQFMENLKDTDEPDEKHELEIRNAPAVMLVDTLIESAMFNGASDIHIEPFEKHVRIRLRIDGHLTEHQRVNKFMLPFIISRLKVKSGLNISEKRLPQDGYFRVENSEIEFRLSILPTIHGEKAVIRLIYGENRIISKNSLGFAGEDLERISMMFRNTHGAILVTGPTGSGKTTTLSAFVHELNAVNVNIVSIEDPVEIRIPGVNQLNVSPKVGLTFAEALRAILRQDPDIIMIGEIRDRETADIAMRSAMTGHLVLSTLHTNDAASAIVRLVEMGVPGYIVSSTVRGVISQRLVRRLCPHCKYKTNISKADAKILGVSEDTFVFEGSGCQKCGGLGYKGRFAVYEYLIMDDDTADAVKSGASAVKLQKIMDKKGMKTIFENARDNVIAGETSLSEMFRAVFDVRLLDRPRP